MSTYDVNNIFAKILRNEVSCKKVYEDEYVLAFHDVFPKAPVHVLVIPKGPYTSFYDFTQNAPDHLITHFFRKTREIIDLLNLTQPGCRLITNNGPDGGQEVPHFHLHILGGKRLGGM